MGTIRTIETKTQINVDRLAEVFDHWQKNPTPQRPFCWDTVVNKQKVVHNDEDIISREAEDSKTGVEQDLVNQRQEDLNDHIKV